MLMPCNHTMHPHCLMNYAWNEVSDNGKSQIQCPLCSTEWYMSILKRYGRAMVDELHFLEEGLSRNATTSDPDISECPGCESFCEHMDKKRPGFCVASAASRARMTRTAGTARNPGKILLVTMSVGIQAAKLQVSSHRSRRLHLLK